MKINFTKMHGLGNDFVVIDAINQTIDLSAGQIRYLADRHLGIGCDQLLLVESSDVEDADFRYRIFNSDGGEVEQCGNGARCFASFVRDQGLSDKNEIPVVTNTGRIILKLEQGGLVTVNMGKPEFAPRSLPFNASKQQTVYTLVLDNGQEVGFSAVSMGNPHAVLIVENLDTAPVAELGEKIQKHSAFPNSVNVGFMQILDRENIRLRVFERGAGETRACGTGACAAAAVGQILGLLDEKVDVNLRGGKLSINWAGGENPVMMTGPTATVFTGSIIL